MDATFASLIALAALAGPIRFEEVTANVGIPTDLAAVTTASHGVAAAWVDWDEDGFPDLVLAHPAGITQLFLNSGEGTFIDGTPPELAAIENVVGLTTVRVAPEGMPGGSTLTRPALALLAGSPEARLVVLTIGLVPETIAVGQPVRALNQLAHGDLDGDGADDLVVAQFACGGSAAHLNTVFRVDRFPAGFRIPGDTAGFPGPGCWPVPIVTDFDGNGRPTLLVTGAYGGMAEPAYVLRNATLESLFPVFGGGISAVDRNADGEPDYLFTSIYRDVVLLSGAEGRTVAPMPPGTELGRHGPRQKWGSAWLDADNDGNEEAWITVGRSEPGHVEIDPLGADILLSGGLNVAADAGVATTTNERAIAIADWNRDGLLDAVVLGPDGVHLYKNTTLEAGHWVELVVPDIAGARYEITACGVTRVREWSGGASGVAHEPLIHVGLGACEEAPVGTVRWPWIGVRDLPALALDTLTTLEGPGDVWVEPALVAPGGGLTIHSTLGGVVVIGGATIVDGVAKVAASSQPGVHRLAIEVDGAPIELAPEYRVVPAGEASVDVLTDPSPPRIGVPATVSSFPVATTVAAGAGGSLDGTALTASADSVELVLDGKPAHLVAVAQVGPKTTLTSQQQDTGPRVRVAIADGLGAAVPTVPAGFSLVPVDVGGQSGVPVPLVLVGSPWFLSALPPSATHARLLMDGQELLKRRTTPAVGAKVDAKSSALWSTVAWVPADGQDIIEVSGVFFDTNGLWVKPTVDSLIATSDRVVAIDGGWIVGSRIFGVDIWKTRFRAPTTVGPITISAGAVSTVVWAVAPEHAVVDPKQTELRVVSGGLDLIPRDNLGQRVGSGVITEPLFEYAGNGRYFRAGDPGPEPIVVTLDVAHVLSLEGGVLTTTTVVEEVEGVEDSPDMVGAENAGPPEGGPNPGPPDPGIPTVVEFDFTLPDLVFTPPPVAGGQPAGGCATGRGGQSAWGLALLSLVLATALRYRTPLRLNRPRRSSRKATSSVGPIGSSIVGSGANGNCPRSQDRMAGSMPASLAKARSRSASGG